MKENHAHFHSTTWKNSLEYTEKNLEDFIFNNGSMIVNDVKVNIISRQVRIGSNLFSDYDCGRKLFYGAELSCPTGSWCTSGSVSDSISVPSACLSGFNDTGECSTTWDTTSRCYSNPPRMCAGTTVVTVDQNILWEGFLGETRAPQKLYFRNNCSIQDAFCIERTSDKDESRWGAEGCSCGSATDCDNVRLDAGVYLDNYNIHTPIVLNILEIDSTYQKSWDACNDLGSQSQSDYLVELKMVSDGEYSDKTIVQAYTVEARTVERTATCCIDQYGNCQGLGCVPPDDCPWQDEMYTRYGLEVAAQVGFIPNEFAKKH